MTWRLPWLGAKYGLDLSVAEQTTIAGIALRKITSQPVHLLKPKE
jgi:hypothetical protein